jgi:phosphoglycerol transferase MdoB-like AlkP superfamily enzyme
MQRIIFIVYHIDKYKDIHAAEIIETFFKGIHLDLSVTGYILALPFLFFLFVILFPRSSGIYTQIIKYYHWVIISLVAILTSIDLSIYYEWGTKINSKAIEFVILSPGEAMASSASSPVLLMLAIIAFNASVGFIALNKFVKFDYENSLTKSDLVFFPVFIFIDIILIRGGFQLAPINQSSVYFSDKPLLNHTAVNTEWNLIHSFIENHFSNENPYRYYDSKEAENKVHALYTESDSTLKILNTSRPNVMFIILESFTSDVVEAFGGEKNVSPFLTAMTRDGVKFSNIYASGDRTDKGLIAILGAFPSQAVRTIIQQPDKFEKLNSLPRMLIDSGYTTSFFYGGESEFANFKSYLLSTGIQKVIDKKDFSPEQMNSKWGAHDGFVFDKQLNSLKNESGPFFSVLLTLSSHEPFEVPVKSRFTGDDLPDKFRKAANYTDLCIGEFFAKAKLQSWYKNTLFIIVADHGHRLPSEYPNGYDPGKYRIPLLFYGEVIKDEYRGKTINKIGSQTDIAHTLLKQLNINTSGFEWSKDLLNKGSKDFAFYSYDNGFGWVDKQHTFTFDNVAKKVTSNTDTTIQSFDEGKAYMQVVFEKYLSY